CCTACARRAARNSSSKAWRRPPDTLLTERCQQARCRIAAAIAAKGGAMAYRKHAYVLVFDGFDDHGVSAMLESVRNVAGYRVIAFGLTEAAVTAASGLRVLAEGSPDVIDLARAGLFVLPAGALWEQPQRNASRDLVTAAVTDLLQSFDEAAVPLAAIGSGVT